MRVMHTRKLEVDTITKLLANGADINAVDACGRGALSIAIGGVSADSSPYTHRNIMLGVRTLLDVGADWNQEDRMGLSAVDYSRNLLYEAQTQMNAELSDKRKWVAVVLVQFLGGIGADRYYAGRYRLAACKLCGSAYLGMFSHPSLWSQWYLDGTLDGRLFVEVVVAAGLALDWLLVLFGRAKDDKGRYITTQRYKKQHPAYTRHETAAAIEEELRAREAKRINLVAFGKNRIDPKILAARPR